jgi:hypothetical protein
VKSSGYDPQNIIFFIPVLRSPFSPSYSKHPILIHPQPLFLLVRDEVSLPYTTTCRIDFLYFNLYIFEYQTVRLVILDQMLAGIPQEHSAAVDSFLNAILTGLFTNIWTLPHFQRVYYMCLCIALLCCMLFLEQKHIFSSLNIYFQTSLLTMD